MQHKRVCIAIRSISVLSSFLAAAQLTGVTGVTVCSVLDVPAETYELAANLSGAPHPVSPFGSPQSACIVIAASDITLDCAGFSITNDGTGNAIGLIAVGPLTGITVQNCPDISKYSTGVTFDKTDASEITNVNASANTLGIHLFHSNGNDLRNNAAFSNGGNTGYFLFASSGNSLTGNSGTSFAIGSGGGPSNDNDLTNNSGRVAIHSSSGNVVKNGVGCVDMTASDGNLVENSSASGCNIGYSILGGSHNTLTGDRATQNIQGFRLAGSSTGNVIANNSSTANSSNGVLIFAGDQNSFTGNEVSGNPGAGFEISGGFGNVFENNRVSRNGRGLFIYGGHSNRLVGNTIFANERAGVQVNGESGFCCASVTSLEGDHLYANSPDFRVQLRNLAAASDVSLTHVKFDGPGGDLTSYTDLSIADGIAGEPVAFADYSIRWSPRPAAPLPQDRLPFAGKFIEIAPLIVLGSTPLTIDSVTWHWLDSEPIEREETFGIWRYNGVWTDMNAVLDTTANTLSISELNPASVFGIFQSNPEPDEDLDGVCDPGETSASCAGSDQCPDSVADPIRELKARHYGQTADFGEFEVGPDPDESLVYTQENARGCTCFQIAELLGLGEGKTRNGCNRDIMEQWTGLSAQADWDAGTGLPP